MNIVFWYGVASVVGGIAMIALGLYVERPGVITYESPRDMTITWRTKQGGGSASDEKLAKALGWSPEWPICDADDPLLGHDSFIMGGEYDRRGKNCTLTHRKRQS